MMTLGESSWKKTKSHTISVVHNLPFGNYEQTIGTQVGFKRQKNEVKPKMKKMCTVKIRYIFTFIQQKTGKSCESQVLISSKRKN